MTKLVVISYFYDLMTDIVTTILITIDHHHDISHQKSITT